ncbi:hypothetical protein CICLE_v10004094mg [Citrus x clementina]|uniref:Uncharacterized protein n=1 Tax=Citrus clementina TaxID=85681 RepID=V4T893_CITCL|nr:hypothetical protein CICLE_v10004094mg [Citrus x clementina]
MWKFVGLIIIFKCHFLQFLPCHFQRFFFTIIFIQISFLFILIENSFSTEYTRQIFSMHFKLMPNLLIFNKIAPAPKFCFK